MRNLLVTGGAGFIGTNFVYYWLEKYPEDHVIVLDKLTYAGNRANLLKAQKNSRFEFIHGDILNQELVERLLIKHKINTIVHFAAESHVDRSIHGPNEFINTNIIGTHSLLKAAKKTWLDGKDIDHKFHHISTDEVYGSLGPDDLPFRETNPYRPNSPYAASKASSDHLVRAYHKTYGLRTTISNCSNNYGPCQFPEKLIPLICINILDNSPLPIYGDGMNVRDWLHVDDHNLGVDLILNKGKAGETYNIGGNNEWINIDIVKLICSIIQKKFDHSPELKTRFPDSPAAHNKNPQTLITYIDDRPGHDRRYAIDTKKITKELGYIPKVSFENGLDRTIDWYLANEQWWRAIMTGDYKNWINVNYQM